MRFADFPPLDRISDEEYRWGPEGRWGVWFGGGVVEGLVALLDVFLAAPSGLPERTAPHPAALGVVPWFSHSGVADRLANMQTCTVVDKGKGPSNAMLALHKRGHPISLDAFQWVEKLYDENPDLVGFGEWLPKKDGQPAIIEPPDVPTAAVGPVRVVGWQDQAGWRMLAHAKLLLLGYTQWLEDEQFGGEFQRFVPRFVWWGSANWTPSAEVHLEMGCWSDDEALVIQSLSYLIRIIMVSEALDASKPFPKPDMAAPHWDDEAWADYAAEYLPE